MDAAAALAKHLAPMKIRIRLVESQVIARSRRRSDGTADHGLHPPA